MKLWKRVLALVLVLTIGMGFEFPVIEGSAAKAEYQPVGTTNVPDRPDELLSSGEWLYWLDGNSAIIAGYTNYTEKSLKIPAHLGGQPVTGIASKAFEANTELKTLGVHSNVTRIASDAFEGLNALTINAYNGSFALWYAQHQNIACVNQSSTANQTLAEGAIDMSGAPSQSYSNLTENSVTIRTADVRFLREGDAIYFPPQSNFPTGLARKISGIRSSGDTATVYLAQPEFGDVFKEIHGSDVVYVDWEHAVLADGVELEPISASGKVDVPNTFKLSFDVGAKLGDSGIRKKCEISSKVSIEVGPATLKYDIAMKGLKPNINLIQLDIKVKTAQTSSIKIKQKIKDPAKGTGIIQKRVNITPEVPFCSAGGVVNGYMRVDLVCTISGEIKITSSVEVTHSFILKNGKPSYQKSQKTSQDSIEVGGEFKIGPEMKMYLVLGWSGLSIRFLEGSIGGFFTITGNAKFTIVRGSQNVVTCIDARIKLTITVSVKIGLVKVFSIDGPCFTIAREMTLLDLPLWHWDDLKPVKKCTLKNRCVILDFGANELGTKLITVNVNQPIPQPATPTLKGYIFDGWYVSKAASGLSGVDEKWNFSTPMPYIANYGALFLYIKWIDAKTGKVLNQNTQPPSFTPEDNTGSGGSSSGGSGGSGGWLVTPAPTPTCTPTPTPPPIPVTGITLNTTSAEFYKGDTPGTVQLSATIVPENATSKEVLWESSNDSIAYVDKNGLVRIGNSGTATITCRSAASPEIIAKCSIKVKQRAEEVYVEADGNAIAPGETLQLMATCYPENTENKTVKWSSGDETIATVSSTGLVTGKKVGEVVIRATAQDGSNTVGTYKVTVEPELMLTVDTINDTLYMEGEEGCALAYVSATPGSVRRMLEKGYELSWSFSSDSQYVSSAMETMGTSVDDKGKKYDSTLALVSCDEVKQKGTQSIVVTCKAGPYTAGAEVTVNVIEGGFAQAVKLEPSTIYTDVDAAVLLTNAPASKDGNPVPTGLSMDVDGDRYWWKYADEAETDDGVSVSFSESGIYEATVNYRKANLEYSVPVTVYVRDADGTIHLRVRELNLSDSVLDMVESESKQLTAEIAPSDAFNKEVEWKSDNESVAVVSQNGLITAVHSGTATVYCEALDGSDCFAACAVRVESFLNLDEEAIEMTVYSSGEQRTDIETVNVTFASEKRLQDAGLNVSWELQKISGTSTELAVEEFTSIADEGLSVSGNRLKLMRINGVGTDEYLLTCTAGGYVDSCSIHLHVVEDTLPTSVSLTKTSYQGVVEQPIEVDTTAICAPPDIELPEDVTVRIDGTKAFRNALSEEYSFIEASKLIFARAGVYNAEVVFSGANYEYVCPITIQVTEADGSIPSIIQDVAIEPEEVTLLVGESCALAGKITPSDATYSKMIWSSYDSSVATVSSDGVVTAIDKGITGITLSIPETDIETTCMVVVEDGMTLQSDSLEHTVFVDGTTRMDLDAVLLTEASSKRLDQKPEWKLERVSGNNLTLRVSDYETVSENGDAVYGSKIMLYSVSRTGDTVYNLTATAGNDSATARITIHAVHRDEVLPASLALKQSVFEAAVNELIVIRPEVECWPEDTDLPNGIRVSLEGDRQFTDAVNAADYYVSQSMSTLSFSEPGLFEAECVYTYSNVRYTIPIQFRICDEAGNVPVLAKKLQLNHNNASMVIGDTLQLDAIFTPADVTNRDVSWSSSNEAVASVSPNGIVTAHTNGQCIIRCIPADTHSDAAQCAITVEDYFTVETGETSATLYLQGIGSNVLSSAWLSDGTVARLNRDGLVPEWTIDRSGISHAAIDVQCTDDGKRFDVSTSELLGGGTDSYTLRCKAGDHVWLQDYTLQIIDLGDNAPASVGLRANSINAEIGETVVLDFTPVLTPANAALPDGMFSYYVGIGDFYEAMDADIYAEDGDRVMVAFTRAGRYVMSRQYMLGNLRYTTACTVNVDVAASDRYNLLEATETEYTVYSGGKAGVVSTISLTDGMIAQEWGDSLVWDVERISGDSMTVAIKPRGSQADLYVADVKQDGTDQWRVTCSFGGMTDAIDVQLTAATPRKTLPESISVQKDHLSGTIGNWISVPLGVSCVPADSALPDTGDAFWKLVMDGMGGDVADYEIKNNRLYINFTESGYYTGKLMYRAGNVSYSVPLYFVIEDEEGIVESPDLKLYSVDMARTVYPEGDTGIVIGKAVMAEGLSSYKAGAAAAYMDSHDAAWAIRIDSGTAAQLALNRVSANIYDIVLVDIKGAGDISYTVSCLMDDNTYSTMGTLHVAGSDEARPDATLMHTTYSATVNQAIEIDRGLYARSDGSLLQSSTEWHADNLLSVMGYEYEETDSHWVTTFYRAGVYTSEVTGYVGNLSVKLPLTITVSAPNEDVPLKVLLLPKLLTEIEDEAFMGVSVDAVDLRGTKISTIGASAFKNCVDLKMVYLPDSVTSIGRNAFYGCLNLTICGVNGSYAETYARNNHLPFISMN